MTTTPVFLLPGWQNSGPAHWQSHWEAEHGYRRVDQHDWMLPLRGDWIARLEEVLLDHYAAHPQDPPAMLVAHSLGCLLVAAWASHSRSTHRVGAAFMVAPGDPEREAVRGPLHSWSPIPLQRLPFRSLLVGSQDDPYCSLGRAQDFATAWGAEFLDYGHHGHINADSGLDSWDDGHRLMRKFCGIPASD